MDLRGNGIGGLGARVLAVSIGLLRNLQELVLDLRGNGFGEEDAREVTAAIRGLRQLSTLSLDLRGNSASSVEGGKAKLGDGGGSGWVGVWLPDTCSRPTPVASDDAGADGTSVHVAVDVGSARQQLMCALPFLVCDVAAISTIFLFFGVAIF